MEHIGKKVNVLGHLLHHKIDSVISETGLSPSSAFALKFIRMNNSVYQKDIEANFHIRRSSVTSLVQNLEKSGYIQRVNDTSDSRLKKLVLTDKGYEAEKMVSDRIDNFEKELYELLGDERSKEFIESLNLLIASISEKGSKCND